MRSKKQLGMYSVNLDEEGTLQIQAPTLLRPLQLDAQQVRELQHWLNEVNPPIGTQAAAGPAATPDTNAVNATPAITAAEAPVAPPRVPPEPAASVAPETIAQQIIQEVIENASAQYPASLAPENRDRFIDQITRHPSIRPLMSQNKISFKQVMLWVEQNIDVEK
ncbi:hypothetical protein [Dictyobacter formicarum]|uniref:Uncharacterized protein n=1 Tax=Dictyobacter formicarum TaxID=2778368 RepID=A0ABQ3VB31_9CHLR|nr:hypothetical protein [Dictyobacter formicarum]GHO83352.1 hypothetical protein KSZ_13580 [Dictyobacter formicarum]